MSAAARIDRPGGAAYNPRFAPSPERSPRVSPAHRAHTARVAAVLALALAFHGGAAAQQGSITVLNRERKPTVQPGTVVSETLATVKFKRGEAERNYDTKDVSAVAYGPGSEAYEGGLKALAENDLANAESLFAQAAGDTQPGWVAAHALLRQADAAARRGPARLAEAREGIEQFLKRFPDHRLLPQALLDKARYAFQSGDAATTDAAVAQVLQLAKDGKATPDWSVRAHLALADLRLDAGDAKAATTAYASAEQAAQAAQPGLAERPDLVPVVADLSLSARVGTATCMLAGGDLAGARAYYAKLAAAGKDRADVQAASANGLAECDFRDQGRLKEAQLGFARTAVSAFGVPTERARALYFLGRCAEELARQDAEPDGRLMAAAYFKEVTDRYPTTRWARLAQQSQP
jgi:outer membrane protein assembly factor BamD (BamD/ComL family)